MLSVLLQVRSLMLEHTLLESNEGDCKQRLALF